LDHAFLYDSGPSVDFSFYYLRISGDYGVPDVEEKGDSANLGGVGAVERRTKNKL
jgi:hypothetical protein